MTEVLDTLDVQCTLAECPVWDDRMQCLWWTDIQEQHLYRWDWRERDTKRFDLPERLGSFGLTECEDWLICAFASGFALFEPSRKAIHWLHKTEPDYRGIRMNDGRVDNRGNFWAGSMVENAVLAGNAMGSLYCLAPDGMVTRHLENLTISNAISFPLAGAALYFADTPTGRIERLDLGENVTRKIFAMVDGMGYPDGAIVDADGCLWSAEWGGARLTSYFPNGKIKRLVGLTVSQPTCPAFGGPDLDLLFVTTAREGLDECALALEPDAGKVLILKPGIHGLPSPRFPLDQLKENFV